MKSAPLGLAGCQEWSLTTEALPVDNVVCLQSKHLRSIAVLAWSHHRQRSTCVIDRVRWNMKHFRQTARPGCCLIALGSALHALHLTRTREQRTMHGLVMTGHNARSSKDRSRKKAVMAAIWSFLLDRLDVERSILRFPSLLHASEGALRILAKGNWKIDSFLGGGRFGRSLLCRGRAEKKTRGSWPPTGCLPVDRNKLGPDSWRDGKGVCDQTHTQTRRHTHGIKAPWTARSPALARTWHPARINL